MNRVLFNPRCQVHFLKRVCGISLNKPSQSYHMTSVRQAEHVHPLGSHVSADVKVTRFVRLLMVLSKQYKTFSDVPDYVLSAEKNRAVTIFRIKLNVWTMILLTFIAYFSAMWGKHEHSLGKSAEAASRENQDKLRLAYLLKQKEIRDNADGILK